MAGNGPFVVILLLVSVSVVVFFLPTLILPPTSTHPHWIHSLLLNIVGYSSILLPGFAIYKYVQATKFLERPGGGWLSRVLRLLYGTPDGLQSDGELPLTGAASGGVHSQRSMRKETLQLLLCFTGLQGSYLTWGVLQEKVMTQGYGVNEEAKFTDSQFLVFVNRVLALGLSSSYLLATAYRQPRLSAPLYKFSFSSLSNIMSSWCQYEALKYISFPTQVLAKASKIIPVMVMGKIVSRQKYEYYEYVTALLISGGMFLFMLSTAPEKEARVTTLSGIILLIGYLCLDSFTSSWQAALFQRHRVSAIQMMCGVNLFSCLLTAASLLQQGSFTKSFTFMAQYPRFGLDCVLLSIASGAGQLFIFETISRFGAVVFTVMMTVRQALAVLLSCLLYGHALPAPAALAAAIVFGAVLLRVYCRQRLKAVRSSPSAASSKV